MHAHHVTNCSKQCSTPVRLTQVVDGLHHKGGSSLQTKMQVPQHHGSKGLLICTTSCSGLLEMA